MVSSGHDLRPVNLYSDPTPATAPAKALRVGVVNCIFAAREGRLEVLLSPRSEGTGAGWRLPGGPILASEGLDAAASRLLEERTGVRGGFLEQLYTFDAADRTDPDVTVAYLSLVPGTALDAVAEASRTRFWDVESLPARLGRDRTVIAYARRRLASKVQYTNCIGSLLPEKFTLSQLQGVYETVLDRDLDKRNFRKKVLAKGVLSPLGEKSHRGRHRPAMLYRFQRREPELVEVP